MKRTPCDYVGYFTLQHFFSVKNLKAKLTKIKMGAKGYERVQEFN